MNNLYKFDDLLSPYTAEEFFQCYYEKQYLYIPRNHQAYYEAILNADDIDLFFQNKNIPYSHLRVVKKGDELEAGRWCNRNSNIVNNDQLLNLFGQGNTLIINGADRSIIKLINYCRDLESELQIRLQFNIYITSFNSQGFAPHYDDHDVFILQTTGTKVWRLYHTPLELPSSKSPHHDLKGKYELGDPTFEAELQPGDLLYIPRGLIHDASTTDNSSVHITLGLHPNYWFDLLRELADLAEEEHVQFRQAVPNALMGEARRQQFKQDFLKQTQALMERLDIDKLLERRKDLYAANKPSEDRNRFKDSISLNKLNLDSVLSKRENILFKLDHEDDNIFVKFYGKKLEFPRFTEPSLQTVLSQTTFSVKDIGGLITDEGKIDLASKFIQEGFLTIDHLNA